MKKLREAIDGLASISSAWEAHDAPAQEEGEEGEDQRGGETIDPKAMQRGGAVGLSCYIVGSSLHGAALG